MKPIRRILLMLLCLPPLLMQAQIQQAQPETHADSAMLRVSLLTASPGNEVYQLEGHTALRLNRPGHYDVVVNWGVFDFHAPNFLYRFVKGETDYMVAAYPYSLFLDEYRREHRSVKEQQLNLTPGQSERLETLISENLLPQNRIYRYNYVYDNCATRPTDIIEKALGAPLLLTPEFVDSSTESAPGATFRSEMKRYHSHYPWYQFGIDLALGSGIDTPISVRERAFAPVFLSELINNARMTADSTSTLIPVAGEVKVVLRGDEKGAPFAPTPWYLTPLAAGVCLFVISLLLSLYDLRKHIHSRWFDTILFGIQFLCGCILTFLIFVSSHEATSPNWLYLWLNPLCIVPAAGVWISRWRRMLRLYNTANIVALALLLCAPWLMGQTLNAAFPWFIGATLLRSATWLRVDSTRKLP